MTITQKMWVIAIALVCGYSAMSSEVNFQILKEIGVPPLTVDDGLAPSGPSVGASDGMLYGALWSGGIFNQGTLYRMTTGGQSFEVIWHFGSLPLDGAKPISVHDGGDGWLYGTTSLGGISNLGTVFRLQKNGAGYTVLHGFGGGSMDGDNPMDITLASDGFIYGVSDHGGTNNMGVIYRMARDGSHYSILANLGGPNNRPAGACFKLMEAADGMLYGCAGSGGINDFGAIYRINKDGTSLQVLRDASGGERFGIGALVQSADGLLFGIGDGLDDSDKSGVFKMDTAGTSFTYIYYFSGPVNGGAAWYELAIGPDGYLYFPIVNGLPTDKICHIKLDGSDFTVLREFERFQLSPQIQISPEGQLFGATAGIFALSFSNAPSVLASSNSQSSSPGKRVQFSAGLSLTGPHHYQWRLNDVPIMNATNLHLDFDPVGFTNAGRYSLVVSNSAGVATSSPAVLWFMSMHNSGELAFYSPTGSSIRIQSATNLTSVTNWLPLTTLTTISNPSVYLDISTSSSPVKFYRSNLLP